MTHVSLLEFARTGTFGPVAIGSGREHVRNLLGPPDDWSAGARSDRTAPVWKYGTTEFHFDKDRLWLIHSDTFEVPDGGGHVTLDPWIVKRGLDLSGLERAMKDTGIPCCREPYPDEPGAALLRSEADVSFLFVGDDGSSAPCLSAFWIKADKAAP